MAGDQHGHIRISRKAFRTLEAGGDPLWNEKRVLSRWEAWIYLIRRAAFAAHDRAIRGGKVIQLVRGETPPLSIRYLMRAWGWGSKKRVQGFLDLLAEMDRVRVQQRTPDGDTYFVVNYNVYHGGGDSEGTDAGTDAGTLAGTAAGTKEKKGRKKGRKEGDVGGAAAPRPKKVATPLPEDWQPNEKHHEVAARHGTTVPAEVDQFKDRHTALGSKFIDWDAAFRTWLRNSEKFRSKSPNGKPTRSEQDEIIERNRMERARRAQQQRQTNDGWQRPRIA